MIVRPLKDRSFVLIIQVQENMTNGTAKRQQSATPVVIPAQETGTNGTTNGKESTPAVTPAMPA